MVIFNLLYMSLHTYVGCQAATSVAVSIDKNRVKMLVSYGVESDLHLVKYY